MRTSRTFLARRDSLDSLFTGNAGVFCSAEVDSHVAARARRDRTDSRRDSFEHLQLRHVLVLFPLFSVFFLINLNLCIISKNMKSLTLWLQNEQTDRMFSALKRTCMFAFGTSLMTCLIRRYFKRDESFDWHPQNEFNENGKYLREPERSPLPSNSRVGCWASSESATGFGSTGVKHER